MAEGKRIRARVRVSGRVQGVFFRDSARRMARELGVSGWIRNLPDGRVEAVFEGARDSVEEMVRWCGEGPPHARVEDVEASYGEPRGEQGFKVL